MILKRSSLSDSAVLSIRVPPYSYVSISQETNPMHTLWLYSTQSYCINDFTLTSLLWVVWVDCALRHWFKKNFTGSILWATPNIRHQDNNIKSAAQILGLREHSCLAEKYIMGEINGKRLLTLFGSKNLHSSSLFR